MMQITTPISDIDISTLKAGDIVELTGIIYTGRDAVLPKIVHELEMNPNSKYHDIVKGSVIFHTAVSRAGVGPTSSNKLDIEGSIPALSKHGVKIHLGKGALSDYTTEQLKKYNSLYAIIPPVSALIEDQTLSKKVIGYEEQGIEAFHQLEVKELPCIIAIAHGVSIYDK